MKKVDIQVFFKQEGDGRGDLRRRANEWLREQPPTARRGARYTLVSKRFNPQTGQRDRCIVIQEFQSQFRRGSIIV